MSCQLCRSSNETKLDAEMVIHFSGFKNLDKPGVWVFSKLLICLDCGSSQFDIPEKELGKLAALVEDTWANIPSKRRSSTPAIKKNRDAVNEKTTFSGSLLSRMSR
jgi:hypothetical protein